MSNDTDVGYETGERINSLNYRALRSMGFCIIALVPFLGAFLIPLVWRILIWLTLAVCTVAWGKRLAAVSLRIGDTGLIVQNFFRNSAIKWIEMRSVEIENRDVLEAATPVVVFETRAHGRVIAWASTFDGLMPTLYALVPLAERNNIPLNMPDKTRRKFEKYCAKRAGVGC